METSSCRICMSDSNEKTILFNKDVEPVEITETGKMYTECFSLELDGLPNHICNFCFCQLTVFYKFLTTARTSYKKLAEHRIALGNYNSDSEDIKIIIKNDENVLQILESDNNESEVLEKPVSMTPDDIELEYEIEYLDESEEFEEENLDIEVPKLDDSDDIRILETLKEELLENSDDNQLIEENIYNSETESFKKSNFNSGEVVKEEDSFRCAICHEIFDTLKECKEHRKANHTTKKFKCDECNKKFKDQEMFESHMNIHKGLPPFYCSECKKPFNFKANYRIHMLLHTNERPFPCTICNKAFRSKWDLVMHYRVHNDVRKYKCDICGKLFRVSSHLTAHHYTHFDKQFECDICNQKYTSPKTLKQHKDTIHSNNYPYSCTICKKKFKRKHHIDNHLKTHRITKDELTIYNQ